MINKRPLSEDEKLVVEKTRRRDFLHTVSVFAGTASLLGLAGISLGGKVDAQPSGQIPDEVIARAELLSQAVETLDMDGAIKKYGARAKLSEQQLQGLKSITKDELVVCAKVAKKLGPIGGDVAISY